MDFRDVYSVNVPVSDGEVKSAKYIMDSNGTTIWSAQEDFAIGTSLIYMYGSGGSKTYTLKDDLTVVGRYGDPGAYGGGGISITDVDGKTTLVSHSDDAGSRKSLIYRCRRGMTLNGWGWGSQGGIAMWNVLGNYYVVVKNDGGEVLEQDKTYAEGLKYNVYMTDGATRIGSFKY